MELRLVCCKATVFRFHRFFWPIAMNEYTVPAIENRPTLYNGRTLKTCVTRRNTIDLDSRNECPSGARARGCLPTTAVSNRSGRVHRDHELQVRRYYAESRRQSTVGKRPETVRRHGKRKRMCYGMGCIA